MSDNPAAVLSGLLRIAQDAWAWCAANPVYVVVLATVLVVLIVIVINPEENP